MSTNAESHQADTIKIPGIITDEFLSLLRANGVTKASIFGSFARGEAGPDSDIDLLVEFDHEISLLDKIGIAQELSKLVGREVDLLTKIHPYFEPYIRPTLVDIPL